MKEGWTYKKLSEVAEIQYGTRVVQNRDGGSIYPVYGGGGATFKMDSYNREDCLVVARFAMSKQCTRFVKGKFFLNDSGLTLNSFDQNILLQSYLDKYILGLNDYIYFLGKGMAQKNLDMKSFRDLIIGFPNSLSEQRCIVAELDLMSDVIEKQKDQIEELDKLAQSTFYDMFGDPVTNEKGWENTKLKDISVIGDGLHGTPVYSEDGDCFFINGNNLEEGEIIFTKDTKKVSSEEKKKYYIEFNNQTIFVSINGSLGKLAFYNGENIILGKSACYIILNENVNKTFIYSILNSPYFKEYTQNEYTGTTIKNISLKSMRFMPVYLPPLALQQEFAAKVEAIEQMKAKVRQSLKESEELFNSRMDYYFN